MNQTSISKFFLTSPSDPAKSKSSREAIVIDDSSEDELSRKRSAPSPPRPKKRAKTTHTFSDWRFDAEASSSRVTLDDPAALRRHEAFRRKMLGPENPLSLRVSYPDRDSVLAAAEEEDSPAEVNTAKGKNKYTPLEQQYLDLRKAYPSTMLIIQVGYKFMFFGDDAVNASKILGIGHFFQRNFFTAMIPEHRINIHIKRLLQAGNRVGVVRQKETAALKKMSDNRNKPFVRELTDLYTLATWVDEIDVDDSALGHTGEFTGTIVSLVEEASSARGMDEKVKISLVSVQPATCDVTWDCFQDGFIRSELECRLLHLKPGEILLDKAVSKATEDTIKFILGQTASQAELRIDRFKRQRADNALSHITDFFTTSITPSSQGSNVAEDVSETLDKISELPKDVLCAMSGLLKHLAQFGLANILRKSNLHHFSEATTMSLNANTLTNLEIFRNTTNFSEYGSLLWLLDRCKTSFGRRLLRRWIGHPLVRIKEMQERLDTVEEICTSSDYRLGKLRGLLSNMPDLEKGLARVHCKRVKPSELLKLLLALQRIAGDFKTNETSGFKSSMLTDALVSFPKIKATVEDLLKDIVAKAARENDKQNMFADAAYSDIVDAKDNVTFVEVEFQEELKAIRKILRKPAAQYVTIAQEEYLIEVRITDSQRLVPSDWLKINSTKYQNRYRSPKMTNLMHERACAIEQLEATADECYRAFLDRLSSKHLQIREIIRRLAIVDCLFALADRSNSGGYCKPVLIDGPASVHLTEARHPIIENVSSDPYVPNDVDFNPSTLTILSGANAGGKSSYARMVALIALMAQIGCYVPAATCTLAPFDAIYTRMGANDDIERARSTFMVELSETSEIMRLATPKSLVILDEIGRGTSSTDGLAVALAVLQYMAKKVMACTVFITHYAQLLDESELPSNCSAWHMAYQEDNSAAIPDVTFLYKIKKGSALSSHGLNVARLASLPDNVLIKAREKSTSLEGDMQHRQIFNQARSLLTGLDNGNVSKSVALSTADQILRLMS